MTVEPMRVRVAIEVEGGSGELVEFGVVEYPAGVTILPGYEWAPMPETEVEP